MKTEEKTILIRVYNNDSTDYADYEAATVEEIREMVKDRILLPTWNNGHSEILKDNRDTN